MRPYLPRFLREGDQADLKVVVNNASEQRALRASSRFDIVDPDTEREPAGRRSACRGAAAQPRPSPSKAGGGTNLTFPRRRRRQACGTVAFKVTAVAGDLERRRAAPAAGPARAHAPRRSRASSRCTTRTSATMTLRRPRRRATTRRCINEQMVVTVDAQLFYTVLQALPYLVNYPYECTEQTLNRFVSTGIVSSVYKRLPGDGEDGRARSAKRTTPLETLGRRRPEPQDGARGDAVAASRRRGGARRGPALIERARSRGSRARTATSALAKLRKAQTSHRRLPLVPGRAAVAVHDALHHARLREGGRVRRRRARRTWCSAAGSYLAEHYRDETARTLHGGRLLLGVRHVPELRRLVATPTRRGRRRAHRRRAQGDARLLASSTGSSTRPT